MTRLKSRSILLRPNFLNIAIAIMIMRIQFYIFNTSVLFLVATQHGFDAITGQAISGAMVAGITSDSVMSSTNDYGNLVIMNKCVGIMDTFTIGKDGYCDNSVTVDVVGDCVVQNVPLMPSAGICVK